MCCAPVEWDIEDKPNGECPLCWAETVDGEAYDVCSYSPVLCDECGSAPCDNSC